MGATYRTKNGRVAIDADAAQFLADYERGDVNPAAPLDYNGFKTTAGDYYRRLKAAQTPPQPPAGVPVPPPAPGNGEEEKEIDGKDALISLGGAILGAAVFFPCYCECFENGGWIRGTWHEPLMLIGMVAGGMSCVFAYNVLSYLKNKMERQRNGKHINMRDKNSG